MSALSNDANSIEVNYLEKLFDLVMDAILCVGAFLMMLWYSPLLTLIALVLSLLPLGASLVAGKRLAGREQEVSRKNDSFLSMVKDGLAGFSVVKSFKAEKDILRLFSQSNAQAQEDVYKRQMWALPAAKVILQSVKGAPSSGPMWAFSARWVSTSRCQLPASSSSRQLVAISTPLPGAPGSSTRWTSA